MNKKVFPRKSMTCVVAVALTLASIPSTVSTKIGDCPLFPKDNIWNRDISSLPVDSNSNAYINSIGADKNLHPDFGTRWEGVNIDIPYNVVRGSQCKVPMRFVYNDESDPGSYPFPRKALIEDGSDRHVLVLDKDNCILYETFDSQRHRGLFWCLYIFFGYWTAGSGAIFDLRSNELRPDTWTSADAAGLPILPGLVRYDEVQAGEITHALRFTIQQTRDAYVWPARHAASSSTDPDHPPMGQRFRLKASFDVSGYHPDVQIILRALKKYGMIVADNGSDWFVSGEHNMSWDDSILGELKSLKGSDFEAVDVSSLIMDPDSGQTAQ